MDDASPGSSVCLISGCAPGVPVAAVAFFFFLRNIQTAAPDRMATSGTPRPTPRPICNPDEELDEPEAAAELEAGVDVAAVADVIVADPADAEEAIEVAVEASDDASDVVADDVVGPTVCESQHVSLVRGLAKVGHRGFWWQKVDSQDDRYWSLTQEDSLL